MGRATPGARTASGLLPVEISRPELTTGLTMAGVNQANDSDQDDGVLWAMEVAAADLSNVEMVVLSACDASQGMVVSGEGNLGLQRAFQVAGARSVVSTLWPVDDLATRLLMERFYRNLLAHKDMSKLDALREAQRWMIDSARRATDDDAQPGESTYESRYLNPIYYQPSFWAAFVLYGDGR